MTGAPFPRQPNFRLVPPAPAPPRRLSVRINVLDGRSAFGRSRAFRLTHDDIEQLIGVALQLEARA
jgi:hypothetical protein